MAAAGNDSPKKKRTADDNIKRHKHVSVSISQFLNKYFYGIEFTVAVELIHVVNW